MQSLVPFQSVLVGLGLAVILVAAVTSDPLLLLLGGIVTAVSVTGLGIALRRRRRIPGDRPSAGRGS